MSLALTSMLDAEFAWVTNPGGDDLTIVQGGNTYHVDVPSGTYRLFLGSASKSFLRVLNAAIAAAGATGAYTLVYNTSPTPGIIPNVCAHIHWNSAVAANHTYYAPLAALLGGLSGGVAVNLAWSTYQPRHCALFGEVRGGAWKPSAPGGFERTTGGRVYGLRAGLPSHTREMQTGFIPRAAGDMNTLLDPATPWWPVSTELGSLNTTSTTARQWSWLDFLEQAINGQCGLALGNLAELLAEQPAGAYTAEFFQGYLTPEMFSEPDVKCQFEPWVAYQELRWGFVLPTTGAVTTRA